MTRMIYRTIPFMELPERLIAFCNSEIAQLERFAQDAKLSEQGKTRISVLKEIGRYVETFLASERLELVCACSRPFEFYINGEDGDIDISRRCFCDASREETKCIQYCSEDIDFSIDTKLLAAVFACGVEADREGVPIVDETED